MLRNVKKIRGFKIAATDGDLGKADGFLFDDRGWFIRYLVADTGNWLIDRLVLLSPASLKQPDWENKHFPVKLTKKQVEDSPGIETHKPVSRQHENELVNYYQWPAYWYSGAGYTMTPLEGYVGSIPPIESDDQDNEKRQKEEGDPHLRSTEEVIGYNIKAEDESIGHIEDFIIDDANWKIRYAVIDTSNWIPGSKKVLISPQWIKKISWSTAEVLIGLTGDRIKNAPEFDSIEKINREYEEKLYDYYDYPKYW